MYLQKVISRKTFFKISFLLASWRSVTKIAESESGSISQRHGSADPDPDPHQDLMDPKHWKKVGSGFGTIISDPDPQHFCLKYLNRAVQRWICWRGCWRCAVARQPPTPCWPRLASPRGSLPSSSLYRYVTNFKSALQIRIRIRFLPINKQKKSEPWFLLCCNFFFYFLYLWKLMLMCL